MIADSREENPYRRTAINTLSYISPASDSRTRIAVAINDCRLSREIPVQTDYNKYTKLYLTCLWLQNKNSSGDQWLPTLERNTRTDGLQ